MDKLDKVFFSSSQRSNQKEIMDSVDFSGAEMKNLLKDIQFVNKWLGGDSITFKGLDRLLRDSGLKEIKLLDIGCGDGNTLRKCTDYLKKKETSVTGIGVDFNPNILNTAVEKSKAYKNLKFLHLDVLKDSGQIPTADVAIFSLFLHHLKNDDIEHILNQTFYKTNMGIIVNDLQRSRVAFMLFKLFSFLFLKTRTAAYDGLVSVSRGFKKNELVEISRKIKNHKSWIKWQWAFRFLWIIQKKP